jgi:hypothetical protein
MRVLKLVVLVGLLAACTTPPIPPEAVDRAREACEDKQGVHLYVMETARNEIFVHCKDQAIVIIPYNPKY